MNSKIKHNFETGQIEANCHIDELIQYIEEYMGRLNRVHCYSKSQSSENPPEDALRRNKNIARMAGIRTAEGWERAIRSSKIRAWHYYTRENEKHTPNPFEE